MLLLSADDSRQLGYIYIYFFTNIDFCCLTIMFSHRQRLLSRLNAVLFGSISPRIHAVLISTQKKSEFSMKFNAFFIFKQFRDHVHY